MTMTRTVFALAIAGATLVGTWLASHGPTRAQSGDPSPRAHHIADAMLQPVRLPFAEGASLEDVASYLRKELKANVVLDVAALDRQEVKPTSKVKLDLDGVRLKTGLKLLLDQVGLTTKVVPEDNLLIITDKSEGSEPIDRVLEEIRSLHRDVHSLQDDVRDLRDLIELPADDEPVARMRNPTIIEEKPADDGAAAPEPKAKSKSQSKDRPSRTRPGI